ncbi:MAG TPA: ABC-F family ATP-binding cassette domain-containing protein [Verrucomicrobium sp.]|nr:ABC-F family ATP-binding cassette domain-containing protein [Verrucomicrobium sp.]
MPLTLSHLCWSLPDGRPLFNDLNLRFDAERVGLVGRNGVGKTTLLKLLTGELRPQSGNISANWRLGLLRQTLQVGPEETVAGLFGVTEGLARLDRIEKGDSIPEDLDLADWTLEARMASALSHVGLAAEPGTLLVRLSGGQRTRAALAALLFENPDFLLLDEPTNHLDREGRDAVIQLLARWRAGSIVVSHDRELLDTMDAIVELTTLGATRYGGNWTLYRERKAQELAAAQHELADAENHVTEIARNAQIVAERKARKDGAGQRKAAKGGMPPILLGRRKERAENTSGDHARLFERRRAEALEAAATARQRVEVLQPFSVELPPTRLPAGKTVLTMECVTAGYEALQPVLQDFSFSITGPERVAVTGPNGSGKSTLLALLTGELLPWTGHVRVNVPYALLDQRVSLLDSSASIRDNFRRLNPGADENACRAALARFMFRADAALQVGATLSGGQMLRAGLACVLGGASPPSLLMLDEPTNHLDIDSIEAVEAGLRAYDGALLIVSHDEAFLKNVAVGRREVLRRLPS